MLNRRNRRSGFTLPEVLVTVAIVAVLAAMVVPAVTQQLGKADAPSFNASVGSLRTAVTSFVSDVRKWPGDLEDLQVQPDGTDLDLDAVAYSTAYQNRWRGPYENSGNAAGIIALGFGWTTTNVVSDSLGYFVVQITKAAGADSTDAHELEAAIDGSSAGSNLTGVVRYKLGAGTALDDPNMVSLFLMGSAR